MKKQSWKPCEEERGSLLFCEIPKTSPVALYLFILLCLAACARDVHYVKPIKHPPKKLIFLPGDIKDPKLRPYVINGERYYPLTNSEGFVQHGKASWYGRKFHGRPTASSEIYDMYKKSAAHKTLPLGTYVKILNISNNKWTIVRINDRGPFVKGRIIDLSYSAAKEIGLVAPGTAKVKLVALGREVRKLQSSSGTKPVVEIRDMNIGEFTIQVGAFSSKNNALRLADRLKVIFDYVETTVYDDKDKGTIFRVWVSKSTTLTKAAEIEKRLENMGFEEAFIVSL